MNFIIRIWGLDTGAVVTGHQQVSALPDKPARNLQSLLATPRRQNDFSQLAVKGWIHKLIFQLHFFSISALTFCRWTFNGRASRFARLFVRFTITP